MLLNVERKRGLPGENSSNTLADDLLILFEQLVPDRRPNLVLKLHSVESVVQGRADFQEQVHEQVNALFTPPRNV